MSSRPVKPLARRSRAWPPVFAGICLLYLYFIPYFPALNNPNENSRVYQIRSVVELHKLSVNEQIARYGMVNDLGRRDGLYYAGKAPGTTFLGAPIYAALRAADSARGRPDVPTFRLIYALRLAGTLLPTLLFLALFRRFLGRIVDEPPVADALTIILALGTMMLPYALIYVNHSLTAAAAFGTVMAVEAAARARDRAQGPAGRLSLSASPLLWTALAGFLLASSAALDYALFPVASMLLIYAAFRLGRLGLGARALAALAAGALVPSALTAAYHTICWGGPFKLSTSFLANPQFAKDQSSGFLFGIVGMSRAAVWGILLSPEKGLFYLSPIFALGMAALAFAGARSRTRRLAVLAILVTAWMLVYACSLVNWDAGWTVGPRYTTVIVPFVIAGLALAWRELGPRARRAVLPLGVGLGMISILLMTPTSVLFPHLPPECRNPVYEIIWPLWRDGITPTSLGRLWFGLSGRADQAPFLLSLGAISLYLVWIASGGFLSPRGGTGARVLSALGAAAIVAAALPLYAIARTEPRQTLETGTAWLRGTVWEPPLSGREPSARARGRRGEAR